MDYCNHRVAEETMAYGKNGSCETAGPRWENFEFCLSKKQYDSRMHERTVLRDLPETRGTTHCVLMARRWE